MAAAAGGKATRAGVEPVSGTHSAVSQPALIDPRAYALTGDMAAEANFLHAWEHRLLPFPINAGYVTRVRQIRRAQGMRLAATIDLSRAIVQSTNS